MVNFWNRNISITPTSGTAAPKRSGRCVKHAPTSKPPLLAPLIASLELTVYLLEISHWAAEMKSSKTFCFLSFIPTRCHSSPYSPPPRRLGTATTPPISIHTTLLGEKDGVRETSKP